MADKISSEEKETSLYLIQIEYLDKELERCQLRCDDLEKQNKNMFIQYSALEKDKDDITEYLKRSVIDKETEVRQLGERLEREQQAAEENREDLKLKHRREIDELKETLHELESEGRMQAAKSKEQLEQTQHLTQQLTDMESLKDQLVSQRLKNGATLHTLREDGEIERERMLEEGLKTVQVTVKLKTQFIVDAERVQHNERQDQLDTLLNKNRTLWKQRDVLGDREGDRRRERDGLQTDIHKITKENTCNKKEVDQLRKKCKHFQVEIKNCSTNHQHMINQEEDLRESLASATEAYCHKASQAFQLGAELHTERSRKKELEDAMMEAVLILRHILTVASEKPFETRWKMQQLLDVLQTGAPEGEIPSFNECGTKHLPPSAEPKPDRAQTVTLTTDPWFLLTRYRPGDLGLVPRPSWKPRSAPSRTETHGNSSDDLSNPDAGSFISAEC